MDSLDRYFFCLCDLSLLSPGSRGTILQLGKILEEKKIFDLLQEITCICLWGIKFAKGLDDFTHSRFRVSGKKKKERWISSFLLTSLEFILRFSFWWVLFFLVLFLCWTSNNVVEAYFFLVEAASNFYFGSTFLPSRWHHVLSCNYWLSYKFSLYGT